MKTTLLLSVLFCAIALPALGELTETDLNKIRLIIEEELKPIKDNIVTLKTDVAWIKGKLESVDKQFDGVDKQFDGVRDQIPHAKYVFYGVIALIVAVVAAPLIPFVQEIRKDRLLKKQIEMLTKEVETLKQQRIVNP